MSDGSGTITYQYNSLSQLTSETRQFSGTLSGSNYALNYEYNLAGELKKITDHTNTTINYDYNRIGQLSAVTGEDNLVEGVSSYASGFEYRAWGAISNKHFGNGTTQQTSFNSRLLPTSSSLSFGSATISWSYDYYSDGRQRHVYDGSDDRFDRLLEFDHVGRLKEAYSGREARGLTPTNPADSPYRQSFQYNAFGDRIQKSGRFWRTPQSGTMPCTPRQANDTCDAEGNPLFQGGTHYYDAAERQVSFEDWDNPVGGTPNHPQLLPGVAIAQTYDGNGQPAKRIETRRSQTLINGGPNTNITETITTTYYVYASVLGGAKVVELNASGNKVSGYVYANGTLLAKQNIHSTSSTVTWHHLNPGTNSWVETDSGRGPVFEQMDPDGAEVGIDDPWAYTEVPATYENLKKEEPLYIDGGDPYDYSGGCTSFGMPISCSTAAGLIGRGLGQINGISVSGVSRRGPQANQAISTIVAETLIQISHITLNNDKGWWRRYTDIDIRVVNIPQGPQKPQPNKEREMSKDEVSSLMDSVLKLLETKAGCEAKINALLSELGKMTGLNVGSIRDIVERFRQDGIVITNDTPGGSSSVGTVAPGVLSIGLSPGDTPETTARIMIGEMIHWAGKVPMWDEVTYMGFFPDAAIAAAGNKIGLNMTVEQYRRTYPDIVARSIQRYGSDWADSNVAHYGAIDNACGTPNSYRPQFAKP
jgi:hypothetical protein